MYKAAFDRGADDALIAYGLKTAAPVPWGLIAKRTATWAAPGAIAGGLYGAAIAQPDENGEKNYLASIGKGALAGGALTAAGGHMLSDAASFMGDVKSHNQLSRLRRTPGVSAVADETLKALQRDVNQPYLSRSLLENLQRAGTGDFAGMSVPPSVRM